MKIARIFFFPGLLISILSASTMPAFASGGTMSGNGTSGNPYLVQDYADLKAIGTGSYTLSKVYRLAGDISAAESALENSGAGFMPIGNQTTNFTGVFHGAGHVIRNLYIKRPTMSSVGLFGYASFGTIDSLGVIANVTGIYHVGSIVGQNSGKISNCYAYGSVTGVGLVGGIAGENRDTISHCFSGNTCYATGEWINGSTVGGIVGANYFSACISNCHSTGVISGDINEAGGIAGRNEYSTIKYCYATGDVKGGDRIGGIAGINQNGTISNCYASGNVTGNGQDIGGIIGMNGAGSSGPGTTTNCYATGNVTGGEYVGGIAGSNNDLISNCYAAGKISGSRKGGIAGNSYKTSITQCFWNILTTGMVSESSSGSSFTGSGLNSEQMKKASSFSGWDFNTVWLIRTDLTFPGLQGVDNAPFALPDSLVSNRTFDLHRLLLNDFDLQSGQTNLLLKVVHISEGKTDGANTFTFPDAAASGQVDTIIYRVYKNFVPDTLWGNTVKAIIKLDETFTSISFSPKSSSVLMNFPNPFHSTTTIKFRVKEQGFVSLKVFDIMGREVATLVNEKKPAGDYTVEWNATDLPGGIYFCRLKYGTFSETKKLILQK